MLARHFTLVKHHTRWESSAAGIILAVALMSAACDDGAGRKKIEPVYDKQTGRLQVLKYDSDGNGKADTTSHMDGARVLWIEIDKDEDGHVDRWEYYDADQKLEKVGFSRAGDGKEDAWSSARPDGPSPESTFAGTRRQGDAQRILREGHSRPCRRRW